MPHECGQFGCDLFDHTEVGGELLDQPVARNRIRVGPRPVRVGRGRRPFLLRHPDLPSGVHSHLGPAGGVTKAAGKGYKYLRPGIETTFYYAKCVEVIDPFGNRIRFNEELKKGGTK